MPISFRHSYGQHKQKYVRFLKQARKSELRIKEKKLPNKWKNWQTILCRKNGKLLRRILTDTNAQESQRI